MKSMKKILTAGVLGITVLSSSAIALASDELWGAAAAAADTDLTMEDMLTYSLQDEYLAHAEYGMIIDAYGAVKPFTNIVKAETRHISLLLPLFEQYGLTVPVDDAADRIELPESLEISYTHGVEAEILNIDMYKDFLKEELPEDIEAAFEKLLAGSEKHLVAFERAVDRADGTQTPRSGISQKKSGKAKGPGEMRANGSGTPAQKGAMNRDPGKAQGKGPGKGVKSAPRTNLRDGSCQ